MATRNNRTIFLRNAKSVMARYQIGFKRTTEIVGQHFVQAIQSQIPPPKGAGLFPGYAAKGTLKSAVQISQSVQLRDARGRFASGWRVRIVMAKNGSQVYQRIHETGGIIRPRRARMLVFPKPPAWAPSTRVPGRKTFVFRSSSGREMIATEYVIIRPKRYWSRGIDKGKRTAGSAVRQAMES